MIISYHLVVSWIKQNWKTLVVSEALCLALAATYLFAAPRIYEANFAIRLPKMQVVSANDSSKQEWKLMISSLDFMRSLQNPLTYSNVFIQDCMGEDSNANRKKFINSTQFGLLSNGDVIHFSIKVEGRENVIRCATLLKAWVLDDLSGIYETQVQKNTNSSLSAVIAYEKAVPTDSMRISDSYIKPQIDKSVYAALIAGLFLAIFAVSLKAKYRA
jgi:hypothetical protein